MAHPSFHEQWEARIRSYQSSGLTMKAWCTANGFTLDQLKYWLYKGKNKSRRQATTPTFVPVTVSSPLPATATLWLHIGATRIEVQPGFEPQLLREVVEALHA